jgi:NTP pyrophosphatase (non-canonical NTP hydrolase)
MKLSKAVQDVKDWNTKFRHISEDDDEREDQWRSDFGYRELALLLIEEEVSELSDAILRNNDFKVDTDMRLPKERDVEVLDALVDILVTVFGMAAKAGLDELIEPAFKEVMRSNWSKLDKDGNPVYYPNGKIAKSEEYSKPDLRQFFDAEELEGE